MRTNVVIAITAMLVLTGAGSALGVGDGGPVETTAAPTLEQTTGQPDPESDVLGWENGYWYNETVSIERTDGLNESERRKIISRAMARVERIRRLEFRKMVSVDVVSRAEFRNRSQDAVEDVRRTFDNVKFEAMFLINESTDSIAVQERNAGSSIGGFYSPTEDSIVVISERAAPTVDELTLGHELVHALQDQHFNLSEFNQSTREQHNSIDGLVEGDANYVQYRYTRQCNQDWNGTCLRPTGQAGGGSGSLANVGAYVLKYQPYSDGPSFIRAIRNADGWAGVNALYENPPKSTEQIIHPALYGEDQPSPVRLRDRSDENWRRLDLETRVDYGELGEAGMFTTLLYPSLASQGEREVIPATSFLTPNVADGPALDPYNYSHRYTAGWDGDKLAVYVNDDVPDNETGYVWKSVWDSPKDAREFLEGYRQLLRLHGAQKAEDRQNTWVIPDDREFSDAFYLKRTGKQVIIVNAPTVEHLSGVHRGPTPGGAGNGSASAIRSP